MKGLLWVRGGKEMVKISGCNRIVKIGKQKSEKNPAGDWKSLDNPEKNRKIKLWKNLESAKKNKKMAQENQSSGNEMTQLYDKWKRNDTSC